MIPKSIVHGFTTSMFEEEVDSMRQYIPSTVRLHLEQLYVEVTPIGESRQIDKKVSCELDTTVQDEQEAIAAVKVFFKEIV